MEDGKTYRVVRLVAENYKRIKAADVTPCRNTVVVAGRNEQGKTSLLDAIAAALGGKRQMPLQPVRAGEESGQILCVLGDDRGELLVKRTFTSDGKTALEITSAEGYKAPSPQSILDGLCGAIAFDPLSFTRMDDRQQLETLRQLVGLDFSLADAKRRNLYDARTITNRQAKELAAQATGLHIPEETPKEAISVEELVAEQRRRQEHNRRNQVEVDRLKELQREVQTTEANAETIRLHVERLERDLSAARSNLEVLRQSVETAKAIADGQQLTVNAMENQNVEEVQAKIIASQHLNALVERAKQKADLEQRAKAAVERSEKLTADIDAVDADKATQLASAKWPIENLSFGDMGVLYRGVPFSQASGAERLAVSFAMAAAMNPTVKVALIRDASLLDEAHMAVVSQLAEQYDMQVWLEVVDSTAGPCGILIEDGTVVSGGTPSDAEPAEKPKRARRKKATPEPVVEVADDESDSNGTGVSPMDSQTELPFME